MWGNIPYYEDKCLLMFDNRIDFLLQVGKGGVEFSFSLSPFRAIETSARSLMF